jgi:hypothetical protein
VCGSLRDDAISAVVSASSLGKSIPVRTVKPEQTSAARPGWWDDASETLLVAQVIINVSQYEKAL